MKKSAWIEKLSVFKIEKSMILYKSSVTIYKTLLINILYDYNIHTI